MSRRRFIARSYPLKYSDDGTPGPENATRGDVSDLDDRVRNWSQQVEGGIAAGTLVKNVSLVSINSPALSDSNYLTGSSVWEVTDNTNLTGHTVTVTVTGGTSSGVFGTDITVAGTAAGTAANIIAYFLARAGVQASSVSGSTTKVDFRAGVNSHPVGSFVSIDTPCGFTPEPNTPYAVWYDYLITFLTAGTSAKFRLNDYVRAAPFSSLNFLDGRMKVVNIDTALNTITVDRFLPGMIGNESLLAEKDNAIIPGVPPSSSPHYRWSLSRASAPGSIWEETSIGPNVNQARTSTLYLRTERDMTADIWVW